MLGFGRRDVEKQRIEFVHTGNETAPLAVMASASTAICAEVCLPIPPLLGNLSDAVLALPQIVPISANIDRFGIATGQSDNGNRIEFRCRARSNLLRTDETSAG